MKNIAKNNPSKINFQYGIFCEMPTNTQRYLHSFHMDQFEMVDVYFSSLNLFTNS